MRQVFSCVLIASALAACGGGGSGSSSAPIVDNNTPPPNQTLPDNAATNDDISAKSGQVTALALLAENTVSHLSWQQTAGPAVNLLTDNQKVIAFEAPQSGSYTFELTYVENGENKTEQRGVTVSSDVQQVNLRMDHTVASQNGVSMRVDSRVTLSSISWSQTYGPAVSMNIDSEPGVLFFDAPNVSQDTLLGFSISAEDNSGNSYQDDAWIVVEGKNSIGENALFDERVADVYAYKANSPYKAALESCIYNNSLEDSCTLNFMPLIAHTSLDPNIDEIMDRVLVSHDWMGARFEAFLQQFDDNQDFRRLLRATTAIVISYDVRPSFYWAATGAIYLDPETLWLTPEERDTINEAPDFRSDFGSELQFAMPWRYTKNNDYAYNYYDPALRTPRSMDDIHYRFASLMYHELAHANDFFASEQWLAADTSLGFWSAIADRQGSIPSALLSNNYPLTSSQMFNLAQVNFRGEDATNTQKNYQPSDVSGFFRSDNANDFYNYSSQYEDLAMSFEELMMAHRFDVRRDVAVTTTASDDPSQHYIVDWGQRGRVAEPELASRVTYAVNRVLPEVDGAAALALLPAPIAMTSGLDWWDNLQLEAQLQTRAKVITQASEKQPVILLRHH